MSFNYEDKRRSSRNLVAYIFHTGTLETLSELIRKLARWIMGKGIQIVGPPFGIYYKSPAEVGRGCAQY